MKLMIGPDVGDVERAGEPAVHSNTRPTTPKAAATESR